MEAFGIHVGSCWDHVCFPAAEKCCRSAGGEETKVYISMLLFITVFFFERLHIIQKFLVAKTDALVDPRIIPCQGHCHESGHISPDHILPLQMLNRCFGTF